MESAHIPPRVSDARERADFVQSHFHNCSVCKGAVCEKLLLYLNDFTLDEIFSLIEQLGPQEKTYFKEKVLNILKAALSPPPAPQNVNPEPPPQQEYVGPTTRRRAAQLGQQQRPQPPRQQQQQPQPHQQQQQQQQQQQPPHQQQQQPQPLHQQQPQKSQTPSPLGAASSSSPTKPCGWKLWRRLTTQRNANLMIVQVSPNGFIELSFDDRRPNARCTTEACKSLNVYYRVKDDKVVDDPRLGHHDNCKNEVKTADEIRREQFCREFLLKVAARSVPPELEEFEKVFKAAFGEARFTQLYGTQKEQKKFKNRISTAYKSKIEREEMEKIFEKLDDFNPDDSNVQANVIGREEDEEETESADAQINERLQNMALSDEAASSTTTTIATMSTKDGGDNSITELKKIIEDDGLKNDYFEKLSPGRRLGTGSFGTVYDAKISRSRERMALKVLLLNDEKIIKNVILEIKIMKQINYINCSNYIRLVGAKVISEKYLRVSEEDKDDPLDGEKEKEEEKIPKLVLLLTKGGEELENFMIKSKDELISIVIQVAATMAMGEEMLELEHRDAHVSNILIEKTNEEDLEYYIGGKKIIVKSNKILIIMIDFGKSRIRNGTELVYCDDWDIESNEPNETEEHGDLHYKIYPRMNEIIGGNWKNYFPETNVLWIRYLIQILSRFDGSGLASEDPGTQAFQKAEESNKKQLAPEDGKEVAEKFFDAIKNCKTAGEFVFQLYEDSYFHYILKKV